MYLMIGELIDDLEKLRREHDSACEVHIYDEAMGCYRRVTRVSYDKESDAILLTAATARNEARA